MAPSPTTCSSSDFAATPGYTVSLLRDTANPLDISLEYGSRTTDSVTAGTPFTSLALGGSSNVTGAPDTSSMPKRYPIPDKPRRRAIV